MALVLISSSVIEEKGHWTVTIQDTNSILDPDGRDTGRTYSAIVAEDEPWATMEALLTILIKQGRANKVRDDNLAILVDLASLETEVNR